MKVADRFKKPDAFILAENSAKSSFSDQLAQRAWRRMFWADNFIARVVNGAPIADIDSSWQKYLDADAEWNANVMISIVGVENYYGEKRSGELEGPIQDLFANLDARLAALRRSKAVEALRANGTTTVEQMDYVRGIGEMTKKDSDELKQKLYILVRCFAPGKRDKNFCS